MSDLEYVDPEGLRLIVLYHPNDDFRRTVELELLRRYVEKGDLELLALLVNEPLTTTDGLTDGLIRILSETPVEEFRSQPGFLTGLLEDNRLLNRARDLIKTILNRISEQLDTGIENKSESTLFEIAVDGTKPESLRIAAGVSIVKKKSGAKKTDDLLRMSKNLGLHPQVRQDAEEELIKLKTEEIRGYVEKGDYHSVIRMYQDKGMPPVVTEEAYSHIKTAVDRKVDGLVKNGEYSKILDMKLDGELIEMGIQISEDSVKDATLVAVGFAEANGRYYTVIDISKDERLGPELRVVVKGKIPAAARRALESKSINHDLENKMRMVGREEIPPEIREQTRIVLVRKAQEYATEWMKIKPSPRRDLEAYLQNARRCAKLAT
ncbi:MAG: hypothetical protein AABW86_01985 [Candidatus Micrarchaeota archaeon]